MKNQTWIDLALGALLLGLAGFTGYQSHLLQRSYDREQEMFFAAKKANDKADAWEKAAGQYKLGAAHFQAAANACLTSVRDYRSLFDDTRSMMQTAPSLERPVVGHESP